MAGDTRTNQSGSSVGGNQAGRDVVVNNVLPARSNLAELNERYRAECESDEEFTGVVDALQHFKERANPAEVRDLSQKLSDGGREHLDREAKRLKELFAKRLQRHALSETAQHIFAYLLGLTNKRFRQYVTPLIESAATPREINDAIEEEVLAYVQSELDGNVLGLSPHEIEGMYYYLAGHCYIQWD